MQAFILDNPAALALLPAGLVARLSAGFHFKILPGERRIFKKKAPVKVSSWAEEKRVVTMSRYTGKWRNELTPYSPGIMDASFFPSVETVIVNKVPQTGISEGVNNCVAYSADRSPAPALYVFPDELTARENSRDRIQPMFTASPALRRLITGTDDDLAALRINLNSMPIYLAWAGSAARLANKPIGRLVLDEIDKYPEFASKKESGPIELAEKRTITFRGQRKIWKISTPTYEAGPIWQALMYEAGIVYDFYVTCPLCGAELLMLFKQVKWPEGERNPEKIEAGALAWYECQDCKAKWSDYDRDRAARAGRWRERRNLKKVEPGTILTPGVDTAPGLELFESLERRRPKKIGFHLPAFVSHFVSLSEIAAAFLKTKDSKAKLRDFRNAYEALPWVVYSAERKEDVILKLKDDRPRGIVPGGGIIAALTAGVDTQDSGFYYEIRAWAPGPALSSWQVACGFVEDKEALLEIMFEDYYQDAAGGRYLVALAIQDAMGHRTAEVYDLTRKNRRRHLPYQGARQLTAPYTTSTLEFFPGTKGHKKPIPGGLTLVRGNSGFFKDQLASKLEIAPGDPGAWMLNSETPDEYARQLCAEYIDDKGIWQCKPGRANHYWDCAYLNLLAAEMLRIKTKKPKAGKESVVVAGPAAAPAGVPADEEVRPAESRKEKPAARKSRRPGKKRGFVDGWK